MPDATEGGNREQEPVSGKLRRHRIFPTRIAESVHKGRAINPINFTGVRVCQPGQGSFKT